VYAGSVLEVDEQDLVRRAASEPDAFAQLYRMHVDAIHGYAHRSCGSRDVAEDVTAATFERALRSLDRFEWREPGIRPWLLRIASSEVANHYRQERRGTTPRAQMLLSDAARLDDGSVGRADDPEAMFSSESLEHMHRALATLRPRYQEAITMRYLAGFSAEDTARVLGCSKGVLAVTLHRAIAALRSAMRSGGAA
jgi:RNA polymerase sigma-70 factor (ECF subfamily)